jgi:putative endonuclease
LSGSAFCTRLIEAVTRCASLRSSRASAKPGAAANRSIAAASGPPNASSAAWATRSWPRRERGPLGELDLVAVDQRTIVFIEVKTRATHSAGHPAEAVDVEKQKKLTRLALAYLKRHDLLEHSARFDVLAVTWPATARRPQIEHYKNAFEAAGRGGLFT